MRFGVVPREWGDFLPEACAQIQIAETCGFDSVWFEEGHESNESMPSPMSALFAVSQHTKMKLGTAVAILPFHHPYRLAEEASLLDRISHGRLIIGVGLGDGEKGFARFGVDLKERGSVMNESLEVISRLLSEEDVSFHGRHFNFEGATIQPRPVQKPRPPIWIGGWTKPAILRAARMGDAWFPGPTATFREVMERKKTYCEELERLGKRVPRLPIMRDVYVSERTDNAYRDSESSLMHMYEHYGSSSHPVVGGQRRTFMEWAQDRFVIGDPETAIGEIEKLRKSGFSYLILRASLRGLSRERIESSIRLFGERVIPVFSDAAEPDSVAGPGP